MSLTQKHEVKTRFINHPIMCVKTRFPSHTLTDAVKKVILLCVQVTDLITRLLNIIFINQNFAKHDLYALNSFRLTSVSQKECSSSSSSDSEDDKKKKTKKKKKKKDKVRLNFIIYSCTLLVGWFIIYICQMNNSDSKSRLKLI